jgi:hypothetical protein
VTGAPFLALVFVAFLAIVGAGCLMVAAYDALARRFDWDA